MIPDSGDLADSGDSGGLGDYGYRLTVNLIVSGNIISKDNKKDYVPEVDSISKSDKCQKFTKVVEDVSHHLIYQV